MALLLVTGNQPWSERLASAASARLAAAVGGVAIGREQQRHMIVRAGIGHPEAQRNHIQEARLLGLDALGTQVVAGVEDQLVLADGEALALEDRRIAAAVVVGDDLLQANALLALQAKEIGRASCRERV